MKKVKGFLVVGFCFVSALGFSQKETGAKRPRGDHFALGFNLNQSGRDFGIGINATTPHFGGFIAVRASENYQYLEYVDTAATTNWRGYHLVKLGVSSTAAIIHNQIRIYGEGGVAMILLDPKMSSQTTRWGGYGVFGFEFMLAPRDEAFMSYFIELGGIGTGATAEKFLTKPMISNGFLISTGLRVYL